MKGPDKTYAAMILFALVVAWMLGEPRPLMKEKKGDKPAYDADAARFGSMLPELSRLIDSFLGSPVFHVTSVNDDELHSTTGRNLEGIIRLSETINKIAKRLAAAATQPHNLTRLPAVNIR